MIYNILTKPYNIILQYHYISDIDFEFYKVSSAVRGVTVYE